MEGLYFYNKSDHDDLMITADEHSVIRVDQLITDQSVMYEYSTCTKLHYILPYSLHT